MSLLTYLNATWRTYLAVLLPICCCPLIMPGSTMESKCGYSLILMAVFWVTEAFPLAVTALLPVILFPLLGITPSKEVTKFYMKDINLLLMGGLIVAIAIEECNLHKRFALRLLLLLGVQPRRLMLGFMLATGILSMWISNTASTAMMIPVARALFIRLVVIRKRRELERNSRHVALDVDHGEEIQLADKESEKEPLQAGHEYILNTLNSYLDPTQTQSKRVKIYSSSLTPGVPIFDIKDEDIDVTKLDSESMGIFKALLLCVCYSANTGGVATLTGSAPQLVLKGQVDKLDGGVGVLNYTSYMVYALPVSVLCLFVVWVLLQIVHFGFRKTFSCGGRSNKEDDEEIKDIIRKDYKALGPMKFAEWVVLLHFLLLVALWLTRKPGFFTGWSVYFKSGFLSDAVPAVTVAVSLFLFPKERPSFLCFRNTHSSADPHRPLIQWSSVSTKFPWGVLLLLGGGFALADATEKSGLSKSVARSLVFVRSLSPAMASTVVTCISGLATEITANTVVTTIMLPILIQIARDMAVNPIYFMLPATIVTSCAFMLPVATPPNAIAFSGGDIKVTDMVKSGFFIKLATMAVIFLSINTWGLSYFRLYELPIWFETESTINGTRQLAVNTTIAPYI